MTERVALPGRRRFSDATFLASQSDTKTNAQQKHWGFAQRLPHAYAICLGWKSSTSVQGLFSLKPLRMHPDALGTICFDPRGHLHVVILFVPLLCQSNDPQLFIPAHIQTHTHVRFPGRQEWTKSARAHRSPPRRRRTDCRRCRVCTSRLKASLVVMWSTWLYSLWSVIVPIGAIFILTVIHRRSSPPPQVPSPVQSV